MTIRPIFVLSLPRSGSTFVQRVLASHEEISTSPEPWLLLPHLYARRETGAFAEYAHAPAARAIAEFVARLPHGEADYADALRTFALTLYERAGGGEGSFFLDKTPRYHLILDELFGLFPDARFVFVWRNPLAVVASIVETWQGGTWNLERWRRDLFEGGVRLIEGYERHREASYAVRFEDLVSDPESAWPGVFAYLGLAFDPGVLQRFADVRLEGQMGDPTGVKSYATISTEPLEKWRMTIDSPLRKRWCRDYLRFLGERRLAAMGYDLEDLLGELDRAPNRVDRIPGDVARAAAARGGRLAREGAARFLWKQTAPRSEPR